MDAWRRRIVQNFETMNKMTSSVLERNHSTSINLNQSVEGTVSVSQGINILIDLTNFMSEDLLILKTLHFTGKINPMWNSDQIY